MKTYLFFKWFKRATAAIKSGKIAPSYLEAIPKGNGGYSFSYGAALERFYSMKKHKFAS